MTEVTLDEIIRPSDYIKTLREQKYHGCELGKFIHCECPRNHTEGNVDIVQYKRDKNIMRDIESKHEKEGSGYTQLEIYYMRE